MASPVTMKSNVPKDTIGPALSGTTGILESALKFGTNVKRIVITSSVASVAEPKDEAYTFTEVSVDLILPAYDSQNHALTLTGFSERLEQL